jgi:hypothetical protein
MTADLLVATSFSASHAHFLARLHKVIGAENHSEQAGIINNLLPRLNSHVMWITLLAITSSQDMLQSAAHGMGRTS